MKARYSILRIFVVLLLGALLLSALCVTAGAAETEKYIYMASSGNDQNDGATADRPIRSLNKASLLALTSGADRVIIVITDACTVANTQTEVAHKFPITYTTNDGKVDYGAKGAKLSFAKGLRFACCSRLYSRTQHL